MVTHDEVGALICKNIPIPTIMVEKAKAVEIRGSDNGAEIALTKSRTGELSCFLMEDGVFDRARERDLTLPTRGVGRSPLPGLPTLRLLGLDLEVERLRASMTVNIS